MLKLWSAVVIRFPKIVIFVVLAVTVLLALQLKKLYWETDARVYLPKGDPAIKYDEKVDDLFGVKDSVIIGIVNEKKGIFNPTTLARIKRITEEVAALPGVIANRPVDVASLSTATVFVGDESSIGSEALMPTVPTDQAGMDKLKKTIYDNADLFVGNLVSKDGTATMIRAKLKEGSVNRYRSYYAIKGIVAAEAGGGGAGGNWGGWGGGQQGGGQGWAGNQWSKGGATTGQQGAAPGLTGVQAQPDNGDRFYLAGRPVIEVTSGLQAVEDMKFMIPMLLLMLAIALFIIFRTARGVLLPMFVMMASIVWTLGIMAWVKVPLYTISTMLPVILVAVSIGETVHFMSHYYDDVLHDAHRRGSEIVTGVMTWLGKPLITASLATAAGFLSLIFAEMPPFVKFALFIVLGIFISWLLTVTFIPAVLTVMKPKVGNYLAKRRTLRVHAEQSRLAGLLVDLAQGLYVRRNAAVAGLLVLIAVAAYGASKLYVDSSWLSDFRKDSDLVRANTMFNKKFDGTIFLNVVIEGEHKDAFKNPVLLNRVEDLQDYGDSLPYVGNSRSVVNYIKNMNKTLHAGDPAYNIIPSTEAQVGEYLFLFSVSGRPQQLDEVIDYDYQRALVTFAIKTDHTQALRNIIEKIQHRADRDFANMGVKVNYAGSANNSYIWAKLLITTQTTSVLVSKGVIFLIALLIFRSLKIALFTIIPVTITTLFVAGAAGWLRIPLDVSTALAAGMAIGVGVDYAVHYIFRYQYDSARHPDVLVATQATMRSVGKTVVFNASIVALGFAVLFFSNFPPDAKLGYFASSYLILSCCVTLVVLPLLYYFRRR